MQQQENLNSHKVIFSLTHFYLVTSQYKEKTLSWVSVFCLFLFSHFSYFKPNFFPL